jgi:SAM-dependent methyltransferase
LIAQSRGSTAGNRLGRLSQHLKWSLNYHGVSGTVATILAKLAKTSPRLLPLRQACLRHKERCFDARFNIETSDPVSAMSRLGIDYRDYVFIDLGSGKGRLLLLASEFPFKRVVGVEIDDTLHQIATRNIARYDSRSQQCADVQSICSDATDYQFPDEPSVIFLYNPFNHVVLEAVLSGLRQSLQKSPRQVIVVYFNPLHRRLLDAADDFAHIGEIDGCAVYESALSITPGH